MPSSKFNEIVAAFRIELSWVELPGNRAKSAVRMSRQRQSHQRHYRHSRHHHLWHSPVCSSVCPILRPQPPNPIAARGRGKCGTGFKVGQLHRQCGIKFELLGMLNKFCGQLSATKSEATKYLLNQLNIYPYPLPLIGVLFPLTTVTQFICKSQVFSPYCVLDLIKKRTTKITTTETQHQPQRTQFLLPTSPLTSLGMEGCLFRGCLHKIDLFSRVTGLFELHLTYVEAKRKSFKTTWKGNSTLIDFPHTWMNIQVQTHAHTHAHTHTQMWN